MKPIFLITIMAIAFLTGCSKSEPTEPGAPGGSRAIRLSAGVPEVTVAPGSRAPIATDDTFVAAVAGWESSSGSATYADEATWATTATITSKEALQAISLDEGQVYAANDAIKTYMLAWYPAGTRTKDAVTFANPTGEVDAMLVKAQVVGSSVDDSNKTLAFAHKTTQLKFVVKGDYTLAGGTKLTSIALKKVQIPNGFTLAATPAVKYAAAGTLSVPGIAATGLTIPITNDKPVVAGRAVMINPPTGNRIMLNIETSAASYTDIPVIIDTDANFVPGKAYTITLTFMQTGISLGTTVDDWTVGTGTGNVN